MTALTLTLFVLACQGGDDKPPDSDCDTEETGTTETGDTDTGVPEYLPGHVFAHLQAATGADDAFVDILPLDDGGFYSTGRWGETGDFFPNDPGGGELVVEVGGWFVAKHAADASVQWVRAVTSTGVDDPASLTLAPGGGVVVAGSVGPEPTISPGQDDADVVTQAIGVWNGLAVHYGPEGSVEAHHLVTSPDPNRYQYIRKAWIEDDGDIVLAGYVEGSAVLFPGRPAEIKRDTVLTDSFIARVDASGILEWITWLEGAGDDSIVDAVRLSDGSIAFVGTAGEDTDGATFGAETSNPIALAGTGGNDLLIGRVDDSGVPIWAVDRGGQGGEFGWHIAVNEDDDLAVTAWYEGTAYLPTTDNSDHIINSSGNFDSVVAQYDSDGVLQAATTLEGPGQEWLYGVEWLEDGGVVVTGVVGVCATDCFTGMPMSWYFDLGGESMGEGVNQHDYGELLVARIATDGSLDWYTPLQTEFGSLGNRARSVPGGPLMVGGDFAGVATANPGTGRELEFEGDNSSYDALLLWVGR